MTPAERRRYLNLLRDLRVRLEDDLRAGDESTERNQYAEAVATLGELIEVATFLRADLMPAPPANQHGTMIRELKAYREAHGCSLAEAMRATGWEGVRILRDESGMPIGCTPRKTPVPSTTSYTAAPMDAIDEARR